MKKDLEAAFSRRSNSNLERCGLVHYLARAEHLDSTFLIFSSQSPAATALVLLHTMHHISCNLLQDNPP